MEVKVKGKEEGGKFKIALSLDNENDNYLIIYKTNEGRVNFHVSKSRQGVMNILYTLYLKVRIFREIFSSMALTLINDAFNVHIRHGMHNIIPVCKLKDKETEEKEKVNADK